MASWDRFLDDKLRSRNYSYRNDAKRDILNAIRQYEDLHPEESTYVNEESHKQLTIIALVGTIPVSYKGSSYNIPIMIQLLHGFPHQPPLVFVRPTSTMVIKPSRHVDEKGRVYLPLLTEWQNQGNKVGLIELIRQLQVIFGQAPPVYAKTSQPAPPPRPSYPTPYPSGGQPGGGGGYVPHGGMPMAHQQPRHQGYQPPYPQPNSTPYPTTQSGRSSYPGGSNPPYPNQGGSRPPAPYPGNQPFPNSQNITPYPAPAPATTEQNDLQRQNSVIDEKMVRMSLLSTAEDKLKQRIREVFEMGRIEQEQLQITKVQLESGNRELTTMVQQMKDEKSNLEANISLLEQKNEEIDTTLAKMESDSENMNIDEAVVTTMPIHSQILDLYAEESAIEDTLYYLAEGLRREVVELDVFLKSVRKMSRKQFMLRATLLKAREVAGLTR